METIGNIYTTCIEHTVEWLIPNFMSLYAEDSKYYDSPPFLFGSAVLYLRIYPNGDEEDDSIGYLDLYLFKSSVPDMNLDFSLSLKNSHGTTEEEEKYTKNFKESLGHCSSCFISRSELLRRKSELLPADALTVVCAIKCKEYDDNNKSGKCLSCKENMETEFVSLHKKCLDRPIKCPDCSDVILLQEWLNGHECEKKRREAYGSLSEDFQKMLEDGINHDLTLKISDKELRAHKDVLRARSQVFKSLLEHDMKEKESGIIDVPDCDPQAIEVFLSYVYSGKVEELQENNMLQLYYIADKYEMTGLKNKCYNFIKRSLSFTNFCDVIHLAFNHSDTGLFDFAAEYFNSNVLGILQTVEWQNFLKDNSTVANELFIKSYRNKK